MPLSDITQEVERLVELYESLLASCSFMDTDDLRQELYLIYIYCIANYDPERGDFKRFYYVTARNRMHGYFRDKKIKGGPTIERLRDVAYEAEEKIDDYIPASFLTQTENEILLDYLEGYSYAEIEDRCYIQSGTAKHRLDEILIKIQEANEQNKGTRF